MLISYSKTSAGLIGWMCLVVALRMDPNLGKFLRETELAAEPSEGRMNKPTILRRGV
jgi:hypothetical protein